ncbi:TolC family protein [Flavobacterium sp. FlaQc-30]|uniref:TolC family protein n=1 Tax=Flavobacterium sp. FlaQc-30 TaxID=3374179 RepID=UPI003756AD10
MIVFPKYLQNQLIALSRNQNYQKLKSIMRYTIFKRKFLPILIGIISINQAPAQQKNIPLSINEALTLGDQNYYLLKGRKLESMAADQNINVAKYSRMPTIDANYQAGISTANNLIGVFNPSGILPISGPPSSENRFEPGTGSAAGILLNWQAVTFGERNARINTTISEADVQNNALQKERFQHAISIISSYLDVLLANANLDIHQYNIKRVETNLQQSRVLANSGIKAGVDTALFQSELSKAKVEYINAHKQLEVLQWKLARLIVIDNLPIPKDSSFLFTLPVSRLLPDNDISLHPYIKYAQSQYTLSQSKEKQIKKSYFPKLNIWGAGFARGSAFKTDGSLDTWDGLNLNRFNYSLGLQLTFPIMKYGETKRQLKQQSFLSQATEENLKDVLSDLSTQQKIANTTYNHSIEVVAQTKEQLKSAQSAFNAMQIRYNTGLVNFSDLIQIQYTLLKSELDVKQAYWDTWKALLLEAAVKGDMNIFINEIKFFINEIK